MRQTGVIRCGAWEMVLLLSGNILISLLVSLYQTLPSDGGFLLLKAR